MHAICQTQLFDSGFQTLSFRAISANQKMDIGLDQNGSIRREPANRTVVVLSTEQIPDANHDKCRLGEADSGPYSESSCL
jgi:hypothetical protein